MKIPIAAALRAERLLVVLALGVPGLVEALLQPLDELAVARQGEVECLRDVGHEPGQRGAQETSRSGPQDIFAPEERW
jgi:hypothetical protein